jgi:membrane-bound lytic murein transglycosylase A
VREQRAVDEHRSGFGLGFGFGFGLGFGLGFGFGLGLGSASDAVSASGSASGSAGSDAGPGSASAAASPCPDPTPSQPLVTMGGPQRRVAASFADLPGWEKDTQGDALIAFNTSCDVITARPDNTPVGYDGRSGTVGQWKPACTAAARLDVTKHQAARSFFEREFRPWRIETEAGADGKMTAYCVQPLRGSRTKTGPYVWPLYKRPPDLVEVQTSDFLEDGRGRRLWGKVDAGGLLRRYPTRGELRRSGALDGHEALWVDDPVDAWLAQIEGSARATLPDGSHVWVDFDGKNGRPNRGIIKILKDRGILSGTVTMAEARAWLLAHPDRVLELMDDNMSMVFFALSDEPGAKGSQGVVLTPRRSLAVDRALIAHTTPVWIDTMGAGDQERQPASRAVAEAGDRAGHRRRHPRRRAVRHLHGRRRGRRRPVQPHQHPGPGVDPAAQDRHAVTRRRPGALPPHFPREAHRSLPPWQ